VKKILTKYKTVAVVGLSQNPTKDSYRVAEYLKNHGFQIIPINPTTSEILGQKCYKSLIDMPHEVQKTVEIVDIFRPSEEVLSIVEQAVQLKKILNVPYVIWMQLGIINEEVAEKARHVGFTVIMDKCMMREHRHSFSN
jgi:predicted CoA-binding protein